MVLSQEKNNKEKEKKAGKALILGTPTQTLPLRYFETGSKVT